MSDHPSNTQQDAHSLHAELGAATQGAETDVEEGETRELSRDVIFDALKNSRRRHVLRHLKKRREPVSLDDLATHVAAIENDTTPEALDAQQRKRVYIGLYQCHLPRLDEMDLIEFNKDRGYAELVDFDSQVDKYLYIEEVDTRPWYHHYVGFITISALALTVGAATGMIEYIAAALLFGGIGVGVSGLAVLYAYVRR